MELTDIAKSLLGEIRQLTESQSVVGRPIEVGDTVIIPVTKLSVGFGTGHTEGKGGGQGGQGAGHAGGLGGGVAMHPMGFLVVQKDGTAQLLALSDAKQGAIAKAIEAVPAVLDKLVAARGGDGETGARLSTGDKPRQDPE